MSAESFSRWKAIRFDVLPRISTALSQFIVPVASSTSQSSTKDLRKESDGPPQSNQKSGEKRGSDPNLPLPTASVLSSPPNPIPPGVTHTLLHLISYLSQRKNTVLHWLGKLTYQAAIRSQKKNGKFKRGAMFDYKAE